MTASLPLVMVTGASRGIGRAIAVAFGRSGWHVVANFRRERAEAEVTAAMISELGGSVELRQADVAVPDQVKALFDGLPRLDALVNNAGVTRDAPFPTMSQTDWQSVLATNLNGIAQCTLEAIRRMSIARRGVVIHIGSSASTSARAGQANYAAAKSGLIGFTRSLGRELAPHGVRVVTVAPGYTVTDMARVVPDHTAQEALRRIPLGRWARPDEISAAVLFMTSDAAAGFTGHTIMVDGGRTAFETEFAL